MHLIKAILIETVGTLPKDGEERDEENRDMQEKRDWGTE